MSFELIDCAPHNEAIPFVEHEATTPKEDSMNTTIHDLVLRAERPTDELALRRLAGLDSARPLRHRALVAEQDGRAVAAIDLTDGRVVADPFVRTADTVALLKLHARAAA
jgi:hypothetical protein